MSPKRNFTEDDLELDDSDNEDELDDTTNVDDESLNESDDDSPQTEEEVTDDQSSQVKKLKAEAKELKSRIGALAQANDARLREQADEWKQWGDNYRAWADTQIAAAYTAGKESAEEQFLPRLSPEEKAEYYENSRKTQKQQKLETERAIANANALRASMGAAIQSAVNIAVSQGVPFESIDTSSVEAVHSSSLAYLNSAKSKKKDNRTENEDEELDTEEELQRLRLENRKLKRDNSGESRTSSATGGPSGNLKLNRQIKELDDKIAQAKRMHRISDVLQLKRQRAAILSGG